MIQIDDSLTPQDLLPAIKRMWAESARVLDELDASWSPADGSPVFTINGRYTSQGWTEWTQGFQFGSELLQFDATGDERLLTRGKQRTLQHMAPHVSHIGVHDHGFNNVSTYGALWRMLQEGRLSDADGLRSVCELALKVSGAVQAARWSPTHDGGGYIYSFNGPHSLFCDTMRSLRSLAVAHRLGHAFLGENDERISLLSRLLQHALTTARYNVFYGAGRDIYDVRGRVAHESIFNCNDGRYRCPSSQQGYSPFTTWTRGAAWVIVGYPEQLEYLSTVSADELDDAAGGPGRGREAREELMSAARASADYYISETPIDGVPYWDTGAPGLARLGDYRDRPSDPFNPHEPVDSSAAAIAAQGLLRLGQLLDAEGDPYGRRYRQAGLTVLRTLLSPPYLNEQPGHQGLLLHSIYHRPRGWDAVPAGAESPRGESCQWGDYHLREVALQVQRMALGQPEYRFFGANAKPTAAGASG